MQKCVNGPELHFLITYFLTYAVILSLFLSLSLSLSLSPSLPLSLSPSLPLSLSLSPSLSLSLSLFLCLNPLFVTCVVQPVQDLRSLSLQRKTSWCCGLSPISSSGFPCIFNFLVCMSVLMCMFVCLSVCSSQSLQMTTCIFAPQKKMKSPPSTMTE